MLAVPPHTCSGCALTGRELVELAQRFANRSIVGVDISEKMVDPCKCSDKRCGSQVVASCATSGSLPSTKLADTLFAMQCLSYRKPVIYMMRGEVEMAWVGMQ